MQNPIGKLVMPLTNEEVLQLQKFKQHLQLLAKGACQRPGDKTCVQVPDSTFCGSCYANSILQTSEQPIETGEPFVIHLDSVSTEPDLSIVMERDDKLYPLITDEGSKPHIATQEMLLRFIGVVIAAFGDTDTFQRAASQWGLKFYLQK